ncbi:MAG TPA: translation initiation factor IF-2 [Saprospiraceae bacterium]|nr:translation initiation factor IF-2 [Saprospiraceae bacterium]HMQ83128.1 translation initiation factor IF-2 [Saprospiraceae bacterium]
MERRLVKIAKELNVGTTTIVDHLSSKGYDIENKPTAKVTDEMYDELLREFQKSIAIKEQADQLVIGTRPVTQVKKEVGGKFSFSTPKVESDLPKKEVDAEEHVPATVDQHQEESASEKNEIKLKVVGKIDLSSRLRPQKKVEEQAEPPKPIANAPAPKEQTPEIQPADVPAPVEHEPEEPKKAQQIPTPPPPPAEEKSDQDKIPPIPVNRVEEAAKQQQATDQAPPVEGEIMHRSKTPELRGLKILGKIDTDRFEKPKKKKKKGGPQGNNPNTTPGSGAFKRDDKKTSPAEQNAKVEDGAAKKAAPGTPPTQNQQPNKGETEEQLRKKRKRKRKKVVGTEKGPNQQNNQNQNQGNRSAPPTGGNNPQRRKTEEEEREISNREIEEKIKATMARMSGGGKKKRQKLRRDNRERLKERQELREQEQETGKLQLTEFVSVQELANLMDVPVTDVIMTCLNLGIIVSINQRLDAEIIELVASEFDHEVEFISVEEQTEEVEEEVDDPIDLKPRAPIVTVMGHVDHGKTSLLDYIRSANVVEGEAGGITQHIGAYEVLVGPDAKKITFLDTPGHEAFTAMRARGAKVTDIAVIIIAADDSIMPQTREAISHAQAAEVPIVFAINKIDKPGAQPEKIKQELASMNFLVEAWGGKYQSQDISAKTGLGIEELLEKILLEAEILELQANPNRLALGTVLEASLDKGRGYVTKTLVQNGTLHIGDAIVSGEYSGKVKAMFNERGQRVKEAGPSAPVLVLGLGGAPQAGERFKVIENEQEARQIAAKRAQISREQATRATKRISLDEIGRRLALGNFKELNLIVKGDVDGSIEALSDSLIKQSIESVQVNVIHKAVGQIVESDVLLASASDAIIIGFQVRPSMNARKLAEKEGVQIKTYSIIYEAIGEVRAAIEGMLEPTKEEKVVGLVEIRDIFKISKVGTVAGCFVQEGKINRNSNIRLVRDGIVIYPAREGQSAEISSLKRFKEDAKEVKSGMECGLSIKNFNDIKVGDTIEVFEVIEIKQTLA